MKKGIKVTLAFLAALVLIGGVVAFFFGPRASSEYTETTPTPAEKTTTEDGFLKTAIKLEDTDTSRVVRGSGGVIEYWSFEDGIWKMFAKYMPSDLVNVHVIPHVQFDTTTNLYTYLYSVSNDLSSVQTVADVGMMLGCPEGFNSPFPYDFTNAFRVSDDEWDFINARESDVWYWDCLSPHGILPGVAEDRFVVSSPHPPGIVICFATGRSELYTWVEGEDDYPFPDWVDLPRFAGHSVKR